MTSQDITARRPESVATKQDRDLQIELLRIVCCFAVVMIHVTPEYSLTGLYNHTSLAIQSIVRAGLPMFFVISGYFLLNQPIPSLRRFYASRLPSVVVPFLIYGYIHLFMVRNMWNLTPESAFSHLKAFANPDNISDFLKLVAAGPSVNYKGFVSQHFWFVYWLVGLYIVTPAIKTLMNAITPDRALAAIAILVGLHAYNLYLSDPAIFLPTINVWVIYYIIGGLLFRIDRQKYRRIALALIPVMYLATALATTYKAKHGLPGDQFVHGLNMIVLVISIFYAFNSLRLTKFRGTITFLADRTYGIYLSHIFIFYYFNDKVKGYFDNSFVRAFAVGILVFALATILATIIDRIIVKPLLNNLKFLAGTRPALRNS